MFPEHLLNWIVLLASEVALAMLLSPGMLKAPGFRWKEGSSKPLLITSLVGTLLLTALSSWPIFWAR
jgi:hypothetical protein